MRCMTMAEGPVPEYPHRINNALSLYFGRLNSESKEKLKGVNSGFFSHFLAS